MGSRISRGVCMALACEANQCAIHRTTASLANSEGCRRNPPNSGIQFLLPLMSTPTKNVATTSATEISRTGVTSRRMVASGMRDAT